MPYCEEECAKHCVVTIPCAQRAQSSVLARRTTPHCYRIQDLLESVRLSMDPPPPHKILNGAVEGRGGSPGDPPMGSLILILYLLKSTRTPDLRRRRGDPRFMGGSPRGILGDPRGSAQPVRGYSAKCSGRAHGSLAELQNVHTLLSRGLDSGPTFLNPRPPNIFNSSLYFINQAGPSEPNLC